MGLFERSGRKFERDTPADGDRGSVATRQREHEDQPPPPPNEGHREGEGYDRAEHHDHDRDHDRDHESRGRERGGRTATRSRHSSGSRDAVVLDREARHRQHDEYGGFNWGAAFFGWIVAVGIGVLLTALVAAAGAAIGFTQANSVDDATRNAGTIGIIGGALLIAIAMIAYYAGGYVAGRMSRFDGARQGFGVWALGLLVTIALAIAGAVLGSEYNLLEQLNLPRIPVNPSELTTGGIIALVAIALGSLFAAIAGGKVGQRYHRKVDRAAVSH